MSFTDKELLPLALKLKAAAIAEYFGYKRIDPLLKRIGHNTKIEKFWIDKARGMSQEIADELLKRGGGAIQPTPPWPRTKRSEILDWPCRGKNQP